MARVRQRRFGAGRHWARRIHDLPRRQRHMSGRSAGLREQLPHRNGWMGNRRSRSRHGRVCCHLVRHPSRVVRTHGCDIPNERWSDRCRDGSVLDSSYQALRVGGGSTTAHRRAILGRRQPTWGGDLQSGQRMERRSAVAEDADFPTSSTIRSLDGRSDRQSQWRRLQSPIQTRRVGPSSHHPGKLRAGRRA